MLTGCCEFRPSAAALCVNFSVNCAAIHCSFTALSDRALCWGRAGDAHIEQHHRPVPWRRRVETWVQPVEARGRWHTPPDPAICICIVANPAPRPRRRSHDRHIVAAPDLPRKHERRHQPVRRIVSRQVVLRRAVQVHRTVWTAVPRQAKGHKVGRRLRATVGDGKAGARR